VVTAITGAGTGEAVWRPWLSTSDAAPLDLTDAGCPLVVAPHPDDEILGVGGLLATLGRGDIVAVTDGEASHPKSTVYSQAELAALRRRESGAALSRLGLPQARVHRLGQPDGGIDEDAVATALTAWLYPGRWCLATWRGDGHPDHEAVGRAAARACQDTGARLLEYPVWTWHWSRPGDPRIPWRRARVVPLADAARAAKSAAIEAFRSQIAPIGPDPADAAILPDTTLARFRRPFEVVFA